MTTKQKKNDDIEALLMSAGNEQEGLFALLDVLFNAYPLRINDGSTWVSMGYGPDDNFGIMVTKKEAGYIVNLAYTVEDGVLVSGDSPAFDAEEVPVAVTVIVAGIESGEYQPPVRH